MRNLWSVGEHCRLGPTALRAHLNSNSRCEHNYNDGDDNINNNNNCYQKNNNVLRLEECLKARRHGHGTTRQLRSLREYELEQCVMSNNQRT